MRQVRFDTRTDIESLRRSLQNGFGINALRIYLYYTWQKLKTSFWFVPALLIAFAVVLSFVTLKIDESIERQWIEEFGWLYLHDPAGARELLSTVAGSMITVAGVVFSITIVVLTLAANQFGPRLIRNFIQDKGNQVVLGTFTAIYLYCLLILRRIQAMEDDVFVPYISVAGGVLLAILGIAVLIYYIHHIAVFIQAETIINVVSREFHETVNRLFPKALTAAALEKKPNQDPQVSPTSFLEQSALIKAEQSGYIQAVDNQRLVETAQRSDIFIYLYYPPGRYVIAGTTLAQVWPSERVDDQLIDAINGCFILGSQPTPDQDVEFAIDHLVEIAVRALSPGINDPFTAISCIDRITTGLGMLTARDLGLPYHYDNDQQLRLITHPITFPNIADAAFNQIRQHGCTDVVVSIHLLQSIKMIAPLAQRAEDRQALWRHATMICEQSLRHIQQQQDRENVAFHYQAAQDALGIEAEDDRNAGVDYGARS